VNVFDFGQKEEIPKACNFWNFNVLMVENTSGHFVPFVASFSDQLKLGKMGRGIDFSFKASVIDLNATLLLSDL
jgi:hypothetical protein